MTFSCCPPLKDAVLDGLEDNTHTRGNCTGTFIALVQTQNSIRCVWGPLVSRLRTCLLP